MAGKAVLVDVSRCIGCRGCQVACKQWNELPAEQTANRGSYQNPPDLSGITYTVVRFKEVAQNGSIKWHFLKDQCRHCVEPPCAMATDRVPGSAVHDANGAVIYTQKTAEIRDNLAESCPYDIPRKKAGQWTKCTFCAERIAEGMEPACVKACPTGTLTFGDHEEIVALGKKRLSALKARHPNAKLVDAQDVRWIFLLHEREEEFQLGQKREVSPYRFSLGKLLKPSFPLWALAGSLGLILAKSETEPEEAEPPA